MKDWIGPAYKQIAKSELGSEHGHTSGIVPTSETSSFFGEPMLYKKSHFIKKIIIEFSCGNEHVILKANVRYFHSKTHKHIHITGGGLMPTYQKCGAKKGDVLLFWRSSIDPSLYKVVLIKQDSKNWVKIRNLIKKKGGFIKQKIGLDGGFFDGENEENYQKESFVDLDLKDIDFPPVRKPFSIKKSEIKHFPRNKAKGDYALKKAKYKCVVNSLHKTFVTRLGIPYMEKHHLIPLNYLEEFKNSLDDINNILCICPLCHRKLHGGKKGDVLPILKRLWEKNKRGLNKSNILVSFEKLEKMYFN